MLSLGRYFGIRQRMPDMCLTTDRWPIGEQQREPRIMSSGTSHNYFWPVILYLIDWIVASLQEWPPRRPWPLNLPPNRRRIFCNTLLDGSPVSLKQSISCWALAPNVHPVSKMPSQFSIFCFHFSAILFFTFGFKSSVVTAHMCSAFGGSSSSSSSCSSTRQASRDQ